MIDLPSRTTHFDWEKAPIKLDVPLAVPLTDTPGLCRRVLKFVQTTFDMKISEVPCTKRRSAQ